MTEQTVEVVKGQYFSFIVEPKKPYIKYSIDTVPDVGVQNEEENTYKVLVNEDLTVNVRFTDNISEELNSIKFTIILFKEGHSEATCSYYIKMDKMEGSDIVEENYIPKNFTIKSKIVHNDNPQDYTDYISHSPYRSSFPQFHETEDSRISKELYVVTEDGEYNLSDLGISYDSITSEGSSYI